MTELEQSLITKFLFCNYHKYSEKLRAPCPSLSSSQLHLIEEYIEAHWNKALDIETLVKISNLSARSIFRHFRNARNCSPFDFVKRVRLDRARKMLLSGEKDLSVMRIALCCGFQSFGHFAADYRNVFGELPSTTLRRARGV